MSILAGNDGGVIAAPDPLIIPTDNSTASKANLGKMRYRATATNSYIEVVMETDTDTYAWKALVTNTFS